MALFFNEPSEGSLITNSAISLSIMDISHDELAALIGALAAAVNITLASSITTAILAISGAPSDGRSWRRRATIGWSIRESQFSTADQQARFDEGWFKNHFRCNKSSFDKIVEFITIAWDTVNSAIGHNAHFFHRHRVAVCLHYLTHSGSVVESADVFGMSKASAMRYIDQVISVIIRCLGKKFIRLPESLDEWEDLSKGFEGICGFPDTCLAVDGSIIEIERPADYEGWYCRKGYPAINAQVVVDSRMRIRDYCLRPGSENDKGVYNRSEFGQTIAQQLPKGKMIVADAGYQLFAHCMTPYEIHDNMTRKEKNYNYLHSETRMPVEMTFGRLKNRFRMFKAPLNQKGNLNNGDQSKRPEKEAVKQMARVIRACFILHNIFIHLNDNEELDQEEVRRAAAMEAANTEPVQAIPGEGAKRKRDSVRDFLWKA